MVSDESTTSERVNPTNCSGDTTVRTVRECVVHVDRALAGTRLPTAPRTPSCREVKI